MVSFQMAHFWSLLCLSDDDFQNHVLFATVVKRDPKLLSEGLFTIKFEDSTDGFAIDPKTSFKMVESTAYFEAYCHILERLQKMSKSSDLMPMKSYIVDCIDYKDVLRAPGFLSLPEHPVEFDMTDVLNTGGKFNITDLTKWPKSASTGLDDFQLEALKMALSQEVAVIQGPPGTGKTFIGLKIAEAYLKNRHVWDPSKASPILVVCYTNHALDQFLEGIHFIDGLEPNIIRIGGRSKSNSLFHCLLCEKVRECHDNKSIPSSLYSEYQQICHRIHEIKREIDFQIKNCDTESMNKIISLAILEHCINKQHFEQFSFQVTEVGKEVEVWLELWLQEGYNNELQPDEQVSYTWYENHDFSDTVEDTELNEEEQIEVDYEALVLQDDRIIEGEEIELLDNYCFQQMPI